jgi:uncharacterized damage-inducible protein DinB
MKIDAEFLAAHLRYTRWASDRMLQAARALSNEELHRHLFSSYPSVHATLLHIFRADRIWLSRLLGKSIAPFGQPGEESISLDALEQQWHAVSDEFIAWASALSDEQIDGALDYVNLRGEARTLFIWQVVLHVVNHGSYHRGQLTTMLRQLGHVPPNTDLSLYYLSLRESS